ncbi:hypothetical protein DFQ28_010072 [Apophysomyces sp. BC1034]|nr:hypothetical protein DFQ30_009452 [Apophysomyces sp. BC1015]KAG0172381.1 hypothetical protein DFQ29_008409 [Apophysomyces sp. BC1021]KAG0185030.1 hypothetical protein DFQ28_010072 [Apophysomyces sp. BC1034]
MTADTDATNTQQAITSIPTSIDDDTRHSIEEDDLDILTVTLPLRPGSDLCSKNLLQEPYIKNIIISSVVSNGITGEAYYCSFTELSDGLKADFIYMPLKEFDHDLPAVIVETQRKVNSTNSLPILVVLNIDGFSSRKYRDSVFSKQDNQLFYSLHCKPWAKEVYVYNSDSIACHLESPMQPLVALTYFSTQQQQSIIALDEYMDPNLQSVYKVAFQALSVGKDEQVAKKASVTQFCDVMVRQFQKIAKSNQDGPTTSKRRIEQYAEDGVQFAQMFKRRYLSPEPLSLTPINMETSEVPSADLNFVNIYRDSLTGRFTWMKCYDEGIASGHFSRYSSHLTLKKAFHQQTL